MKYWRDGAQTQNHTHTRGRERVRKTQSKGNVDAQRMDACCTTQTPGTNKVNGVTENEMYKHVMLEEYLICNKLYFLTSIYITSVVSFHIIIRQIEF